MNSPENAFELALHQDFQKSLRQLGYVVLTDCFRQACKDTNQYVALVMPQEEFGEKLSELNMASYEYWRDEAQAAARDGRRIAGFVSLTELPWEILARDSRMCSSDSAWEALANSSETAARLVDNAPDNRYIPLSDTTFFQ